MSSDEMKDHRPDLERMDGTDPESHLPKVADPVRRIIGELRNKLLDVGKRNRLIHTPLRSSRIKQIRIFGSRSDEVFEVIRSENKPVVFRPVADTSDDRGTDNDDVYVPPTEESEERTQRASVQTNLTAEALQKRLLSLYRDDIALKEGLSVHRKNRPERGSGSR